MKWEINMKKVLFVATVGSFFSFECNDMKILQSLRYEVHIAANLRLSEHDDFQANGIIRHQVDFARIPWSKTNLNAYKQLRKIFAEAHFDLVHCHTPMGGVLGRLTALKYRKSGTKIIYTAHGFHFYKGAPIKNWLLYYPVEWICAWWTDVLITINKEDYARAKKHMHAKRVEYIPGVGVDMKKFSAHKHSETERLEMRRELGLSAKSFVLLSVGELQSRKNHKVVIEALAELQNPNISYLIAGEGELREAYQNLIDEKGLSDSVKLLGFRSDIAELCEIADCFVHPSVREGLGIAPLEGMASGLPLISAKINGILDYTEDGKTGCCVDPRSVEEMKNAIIKMYENAAFRYACGSHNIDVVKAFSMEESMKAMKRIYCENMGNRE